MEGEITQDDLTCYTSDGNKEREKCLEQDKREIPISSLVTVKPSTKSAIRLQEPIRIFIPHQANRGCRELIVRASIDGGTWKTMDYESGIPPQVDLEDIPMVQIAINNFKSVGIIVASRPKMHAFSLGRDGGTVETDSPNKTILTAPNGCFSEKTNGSIQITDKKHSTEMAQDVDDLRNAQVALTPHTITLDKKSKSNLTLEVYPELKKRVTRSQSALKACENIMIKKMDAEKVADILYGKGTMVNSSTIQEIKRKKLPEDKAMALLEKLKFCDEDQFQDLVDSLEESNQQNIANELKKALGDIEHSELGSDFVDASEDKVALLSCKNGEGWTIVDFDKVKDVPGACRLQLFTGGKSYSVVGLIVPKSTKDSELSRLAELFYTSSEQFRMRLIVKQHSENKYRLAIRCVNPEMFSTTMAELRNMSYTKGPSESFEFNVKEGETIWLQLLGNRKFVSQQSPEVNFKVYLSSIYTMDVRISEPKGKESTSKFRNDL